MSDTPRTDAARPPYSALQEFVLSEFARTLERELNAANELIVRLQAVTNDPHALWVNWLRGSVTLPVGIGDVREYQDRIKRLEEWKESAMAVEREWNPNSLSKMLGGQLGESQRVVIMREVPKLQERIKRLEEAGDYLCAAAAFMGWHDKIETWNKAKEAKL